MNNTVQYKLEARGRAIPVGTTKPYYDGSRRAWITAVGVFPAMNPGDYSVSAHIEATVSPAIPPGKPVVVIPDTGAATSPTMGS